MGAAARWWQRRAAAHGAPAVAVQAPAQAWVQLLGHRPVGVAALALTPDAQHIATGHRDGLLRLVGVRDGRVLHTHAFDSAVRALACAPDGRHLAVGTADGQVRLFDLTHHTLRPLLPAGPQRVHALAFCPAGRHLAVGRGIGIDLLDAVHGTPLQRLGGHADSITCLAFSADARWLVSGSLDGTLRTWNPDTGASTHALPNLGRVAAVALSGDGLWLAVGSVDGTVAVLQWHPAGLGRQRQIEGAGGTLAGLAFSPDSQWLAVGRQRHAGRDGGSVVRLWDARHGTHHRDIAPGGMALACLAYAPDGRWLACGAPDGGLHLAALATGVAPLELRRPESPVTCATVAGAGRRLASGHEDGSVALWRPGTGALAHRLAVHHAPLSAVAMTPDGRWLASAARDGTVAVWPPRRAPCALQAPAAVTCLALSPDARWLVLGAADGCMHSVALAALPRARLTKGHDFGATLAALAFAPDGGVLAMATRQGLLSLWALRADGPAARADLPGLAGTALAFSPDGRWLASGRHDGSVCLWDRAAHREARRLHGPHPQATQPTHAVTHLCFDAAGDHLAAVDAAGRSWQWPLAGGAAQALQAPPPFRHAVLGLAALAAPLAPQPFGDDTLALRPLGPAGPAPSGLP